MSDTKYKFMDVDVISFLEKIMKSNTEHYQQDFEIDKKIISDCARSDQKHDKTLLWLSRPMGTQCVKEYEAFIRDTADHTTWRFYAEQMAGQRYVACAVELTGQKDGVVRGNVYDIDFMAHAAEVAKKAVAPLEYIKTYADGYEDHVPFQRSSAAYYSRQMEDHGEIVSSVAVAEDNLALSYVLREQKAARDKLKEHIPQERGTKASLDTLIRSARDRADHPANGQKTPEITNLTR